MSRLPWLVIGLLLIASSSAPGAEEQDAVKAALGREILAPGQATAEAEDDLEARIPRMPAATTVAEWERAAQRMRAATLRDVVFRGAAASWRDARTRVEWLGTIPGGPGYAIKKLRYEALPGLWIPALLYEPEALEGKVPAVLNVNGHDGQGKAADYKQIRCINQARRGMLALNVEWLGMGQLASAGNGHGLINAIDLCGTSGIAVHYLYLSRALDLLLALEHTDPDRVAVTGLSGGGWQTIFISALDLRVKLCVPVAGYSSFRTRVRHHSDLGDSEQTPCDLATVTDYAPLTAMLAPRPTLLVYNAKDNCCFRADHALPPLLEAAGPIFRLYGKPENLRSHVNDDPGTHNYGRDNRQALYRMLGDHFFPGDSGFTAEEIPSDSEVKPKDALRVELPADNLDLATLALELSRDLPRDRRPPRAAVEARAWFRKRRQTLRGIVRARDATLRAEKVADEEHEGLKATFWRLKIGDTWTVPAVELSRGEPTGTALLVADAGRQGVPQTAAALLARGRRVLAVDPFYIGESHFKERDYLFALLLAAVGDRPLGVQAGQLAAVARWARQEHSDGPVTLVAVGPRTSTMALVAAALEEEAIGVLELHSPLGSLKEVIEQKHEFAFAPELFCFGLLEAFDIRDLAALVAPRPIAVRGASERARQELGGEGSGVTFEPAP
jgi:dienelactone hydrolase